MEQSEGWTQTCLCAFKQSRQRKNNVFGKTELNHGWTQKSLPKWVPVTAILEVLIPKFLTWIKQRL
jgi:hypothetical protein